MTPSQKRKCTPKISRTLARTSAPRAWRTNAADEAMKAQDGRGAQDTERRTVVQSRTSRRHGRITDTKAMVNGPKHETARRSPRRCAVTWDADGVLARQDVTGWRWGAQEASRESAASPRHGQTCRGWVRRRRGKHGHGRHPSASQRSVTRTGEVTRQLGAGSSGRGHHNRNRGIQTENSRRTQTPGDSERGKPG